MVQRKLIVRFFLLLTPTVVVAVAAIVLMAWRIPTRVELQVAVNRALFTLGGSSATSIMHLPKFQSLTIEKFAQLRLSPEELEIADPTQFIPNDDRYPEFSWKSLAFIPPIVITGLNQRLQPSVTVEFARADHKAGGTLDRLWGNPGAEVTITVRDKRTAYLGVQMSAQQSSMNLLLHEPFQMIVEFGSISGIKGPQEQLDSRTFRVRLPDHIPEITIRGQPDALLLMTTMSLTKAVNIAPKGGIPISAIDFTRQGFKDSKGKRETTMVEDGVITYPDYPDIERIPVKASDFIALDGLKKFRIQQIVLDPESEGLKLRLGGIATHIATASPEFKNDYRLTRFDQLWKNKRLVILFGIVVWVFPTTVAAMRLYKDLLVRIDFKTNPNGN